MTYFFLPPDQSFTQKSLFKKNIHPINPTGIVVIVQQKLVFFEHLNGWLDFLTVCDEKGDLLPPTICLFRFCVSRVGVLFGGGPEGAAGAADRWIGGPPAPAVVGSADGNIWVSYNDLTTTSPWNHCVFFFNGEIIPCCGLNSG